MLKLKHYMSKLQRYPTEYWILHFVVWIIYFLLLLSYNYFELEWEKNSELICTIIFCQCLLFGLAAYGLRIIYQKRDWVENSLRKQAILLGLFSLIFAIISQVLGFSIQSLFSPETLDNQRDLLNIQPIFSKLLQIMKELEAPSTKEEIENFNTLLFKALWGKTIQNIIAHFSFLYWWSMFYTRIQDRLLTGLIDIRVKNDKKVKMIHLADVYFARSKTDDQSNSNSKEVEIYTKDSAYIYQGSITKFNKEYNRYLYYRKFFGPATRRFSDVPLKKQSRQVYINYTKCKYDKENPNQVFFERDEDTKTANTILLSPTNS